VFVSHTGNIYPSGFLPVSAGNVRHDSLVDVYRHSPLFRTLRDSSRLGGKCGDCEFRNLCGGSRSRAFALTGDFLAQDPRCVYQPRSHDRPVAVAAC
jgi:radical SAM protein with 4Fe4S-binding SPASM domain